MKIHWLTLLETILLPATNLSIPIVNAEGGVINLDENTFAPDSDGQPRLILGDDGDNYINESSNGSVQLVIQAMIILKQTQVLIGYLVVQVTII